MPQHPPAQWPGLRTPGAPDLSHVTLACDLDGTLVDTAPDLHRALVAVMEEAGLPAPELPSVRRLVGQGARALITRAVAAAGVAASGERIAELTERYVEIYASDIAQLSRPFEGVEAALDDLAASGVRLVVCTNKRTHLSEMLLESLGLAGRFLAIVGADAVSRKKPDPAHLIEAIRTGGGDERWGMMIGDGSPDIDAARSAGLPSIAVRFGYPDRPVDDLGADAVIAGWAEAPVGVRQLARRPDGGGAG